MSATACAAAAIKPRADCAASAAELKVGVESADGEVDGLGAADSPCP